MATNKTIDNKARDEILSSYHLQPLLRYLGRQSFNGETFSLDDFLAQLKKFQWKYRKTGNVVSVSVTTEDYDGDAEITFLAEGPGDKKSEENHITEQKQYARYAYEFWKDVFENGGSFEFAKRGDTEVGSYVIPFDRDHRITASELLAEIDKIKSDYSSSHTFEIDLTPNDLIQIVAARDETDEEFKERWDVNREFQYQKYLVLKEWAEKGEI